MESMLITTTTTTTTTTLYLHSQLQMVLHIEKLQSELRYMYDVVGLGNHNKR